MYSKRAVALSVALHGLLILVLTVSVDFLPDKLARPAAPRPIVQAHVVDQAAVAREVERLKAADTARQQEQDRRQREIEDKRRAEEKRLQELEARKERLKQEQKVAAAAKAEAERKAAAARAEAAAAERKAAAAKEKTAAEAKARARAEAQAAAEAKAKADAEAAARAKAEAAKKQAAEEARKKAEAERKRLEQALQAELEAEEAAAQAAADSSELNRFLAAIHNRVIQSYTILPGFEGLSCTLRITLVPGGEVAGVQIVKSSGNPAFDRQAENAVRKAAPLPVPSEPRLFQQMRSINFVFDPQS